MELDNEIFQLATLGGLALLLLLLLLVLSSLSRVHKTLRSSSSGTPAAAPGAAEPQALSEPSATTSFAAPAYAQPAAAYAQPGGAAPAPEPVPVQPAPQAAVPAQEPQDQPFERDGRWWFRRGNELLVYDEQSAQWVPAPAGAAGGQPGAMGEADAGFWKCPSCGAVNGATATSCRMCFTARV